MYPPSPSSLGAHVNESCHTHDRTASAATTLTHSQQHTLQCTLPLRVRHVASTRVQKKACEDAKVLKQNKWMKQNLQAPRNRVQKKGLQSGVQVLHHACIHDALCALLCFALTPRRSRAHGVSGESALADGTPRKCQTESVHTCTTDQGSRHSGPTYLCMPPLASNSPAPHQMEAYIRAARQHMRRWKIL